MRLGTMLLRDAVITLTQLEQSLRAQVLSGGRLGTNLVELGYVDLNTLGRYLARVLDMPLAIADRFEKADPKLIEAFGAEMADRYSAIPLALDAEDPNTVHVVMRDPSDTRAISAIESHLGLQVRPMISAELRLFYYLERYYGIRRRTRFTRNPDQEDQTPNSRRERRSTQPFRGLSTPTMVNISPRKADEEKVADTPPKRPPVVMSFEEARAIIVGARHRNDIAEALLQFSVGRFECAALFMVRARNAIGWRARAAGLGEDALERLNIPLGGSSVFQAAHDSAKMYRGKAIATAKPMVRELWSIFALEHEPSDLIVVPVTLVGRVVNLVYAHSFPGLEASDEEVEELAVLAGCAADAYGRMIATTTEA